MLPVHPVGGDAQSDPVGERRVNSACASGWLEKWREVRSAAGE